MESPAYRNLSTNARCLLDELLILYRPKRNGEIGLDVRTAAKRLGVSTNTTMDAFDALTNHGFLVESEEAAYLQQKARTWRLTFLEAHNQQPTDDWKTWAPGNPVRISSRPKNRQFQKQRQAVSTPETKHADEAESSLAAETMEPTDNQESVT